MAQDATPAELLREARNAASDAAIEAREEVLTSGRTKRTGKRRSRRAKRAIKDGWHQFDVDVWITDLNPTEFGVYKRSRNKAKSRQFTTDMDIFAEIKENGERIGLLGYREELWTKQTGFDRRLVFKLFGGNLNWRATMDLLLARSVQETIGARGLPVPTFAINTSDHDHVVYLARSANKWRGMPEYFSFFLLDDKKVRVYRLKQDLISIGRDYSLYDGAGERVGVLDGKLLSLGGYWQCFVAEHHADPLLLSVLKLFIGMLVFNGSCRRHVARLARDVAAGKIEPALHWQEKDLYMNPRRVR